MIRFEVLMYEAIFVRHLYFYRLMLVRMNSSQLELLRISTVKRIRYALLNRKLSKEVRTYLNAIS
jgi:hypothetical protein